MEKIIELLNEYEKDGLNEFETYVERWYCERTHQILSGKWENNNELKPCQIISKQYGFIERLVKEDKIDTECQKVLHTVGAKAQGIGLECLWYSDYESLLMILSIQDNPIEYLCSILKE